MSVSQDELSLSRVHGLIEAAQDIDHVGVRDELEEIDAAATGAGLLEVAQLAASAVVLYDLVHSQDTARVGADCEDLVQRAEALGSLGARAVALALRSVHAATSPDKSALLSDAGLAAALVERDDVAPYDRCFVWTTLSNVYLTLNLWELADELNDRAAQHASSCEDPAQQFAAVFSNRILIRLAWAAALLEHGDEDQALRHLRDAQNAARRCLAARDQGPRLWRREAEATRDLLTFVLHAAGWSGAGGTEPDPAADLARITAHREFLTSTFDAEVLPFLDAFTAYGLLRLGRAEEAQAFAGDRPASATNAPSQTFSAWIQAQASTPDQPDRATLAHRDYGRLVCELRWTARVSVLATARARIDDQRLAAEHAILSREARKDALTGLENRRGFDRWLAGGSDLAGLAALVLVDVDDFKQVNDRHGHSVGDEVLRRIAAAIGGSVRERDVAVRLGGDEFAVILTSAERTREPDGALAAIGAVAAARARAIAEAVAHGPWAELAPDLAVTVSVGHARRPHRGAARGRRPEPVPPGRREPLRGQAHPAVPTPRRSVNRGIHLPTGAYPAILGR